MTESDEDVNCPECGGFNTIREDWHYWICDTCGKAWQETPVGVDDAAAELLQKRFWAEMRAIDRERKEKYANQNRQTRS